MQKAIFGLVIVLASFACKSPKSVTHVPNDVVRPVNLGIGTLCLDTQSRPTIETLDSFLDPKVRAGASLFVSGRAGDQLSNEYTENARFSATAELFRMFGLIPEIRMEKYKHAQISANAVRKRVLHWGNIQRAIASNQLRQDAVEHLFTPGCIIVTEDTVVEGLQITIARTNLSQASLKLLNRSARNNSSAAELSVVAIGDRAFRLSSKRDVVIDPVVTTSQELQDILRKLNIARPTVTASASPEREMRSLRDKVTELEKKNSELKDELANTRDPNLQARVIALENWNGKAREIINKPVVKDWNRRGGRRAGDAEKIRLKALLNEINPGKPELLSRNSSVVDRLFDYDED